MTLDEDLITPIERQRRLLLIMLQDTDNVEIALGYLSITNRLYRKIELYCPLLLIRSYRDFAETVAYVNLRPSPLAAHDFSRDRAEQGLNLECRHLNVLLLGMCYPRFDEVVAQGKAHRVGLVGLGDWLARQEGYDKKLCQWVEVVWSKSPGLATDIELDSNQSVEVFRDRLRNGGEGPAMVMLPTGRFRMGDLDGVRPSTSPFRASVAKSSHLGLKPFCGHFLDAATACSMTGAAFWMLRLRAA